MSQTNEEAGIEEFQSFMDESDKEFILKQEFKETKMEPNKNDSALTFSLINGNPGLVVRADTVEQMDALVDRAIVSFNRFKASLGIGRVAPVPQAPVVNSTTNTTVSGQSVAPNSAQPTDDGLRVPCKECKGPTEYRDFISKANNHVKGYFCLNKNLKCKPYYVK